MNKEILIAQLEAMRAQLDAALFLLAEPETEERCLHPPESRINMSTMGKVSWECRICGYRHEEVT